MQPLRDDYYFKAYDLLVQSFLDPPFRDRLPAGGAVDVRIRRSERPLDEFSSVQWVARVWGGHGRSYDVGADILVCFSDYIRMAIRKNGRSITLDTDDGHVDEGLTCALGPGISISMLCRRTIPLHAASVEIDGRLVRILGRAGAGKSTLLWTLLERGAKYATDDVLPIRMVGGSAVAAASMLSQLKLWGNDLDRWGVDRSRCRELYPGSEKVRVQLESDRCVYGSNTLKALFILEPHEDSSTKAGPALARHTGAKAVTGLLAQTHSFWAVPDELKTDLFPRYGDLARALPMYTLAYPLEPRARTEAAKLIERTAAASG